MEGRYLELRAGASWTYRVSDQGNGQISEKTQTVGELEDVGGAKAGVTAFRVTTTKPAGSVVSWQEDTGESIVRHREQDSSGVNSTDEFYTPLRTRFDGSADRMVVGATWDESYTETVSENGAAATVTNKVESWTVMAVDETVVVPAGRFCAIQLRRASSVDGNPGSIKTYWFTRSIGKIKEVGENQTETLESFE